MPLLKHILFLCVTAAVSLLAAASPSASAETISNLLANTQTLPGFFPLLWDTNSGQLWLEISHLDEDFIYYDSLPAGFGSSDLGLDRGELGRERLLRFTRAGKKILLMESNLGFRAPEGSAAEQRAVHDSFPQSVLAGFTVACENASHPVVDATSFFLRDIHNVGARLREAKQGSFSIDEARSAVYMPNTKNFPSNTEVESLLTFTGSDAGPVLRNLLTDPNAFTVRLHHSFVALPPPGYAPRAFDPRAGYFDFEYADYSAPLGESIARRFITRHRLAKKNPSATRSEAVAPIVYYLDPGTPEPVRGALLDGARWWSQAFEAAGYINAFRVEMLPDDADPMDARYNVIEWVHRYTRGWSYGSSITDPRTGEIIKGVVTLGSLRVRQDYLLAEGLLAPYENGRPASPEMTKMALARMRQLGAHEVGHTLGLAHNFIASAFDRASVMDYPPPLAQLRSDGSVDLSQAYATGIGEWDKVAIAYGYQDFPSGTDEPRALANILDSARARGLIFLTDQDARPAGSAHPLVHLWDTGTNAVDALQKMLALRRAVLARFGENNIKPGAPLATIEDVLVPAYLMHRYQLEAAAKSIAGVTYTYALRGDGQIPTIPVPPEEQRRALKAILGSLAPNELKIPDSVRKLIPPRPEGFARHEDFGNDTGGTFDALAPAEAAAEIAFHVLLDPARAARLIEQHALDAAQPSLNDIIDAILNVTWLQSAGSDELGEIQRSVNYIALRHLIDLLVNPAATPQTKAILADKLETLARQLRHANPAQSSDVQRQHLFEGARLIENYFAHPGEYTPLPRALVPPGMPIGSFSDCDAW